MIGVLIGLPNKFMKFAVGSSSECLVLQFIEVVDYTCSEVAQSPKPSIRLAGLFGISYDLPTNYQVQECERVGVVAVSVSWLVADTKGRGLSEEPGSV